VTGLIWLIENLHKLSILSYFSRLCFSELRITQKGWLNKKKQQQTLCIMATNYPHQLQQFAIAKYATN